MPSPADRERLAFITLALVPGIGHARLRALIDEFGSAVGALTAPFARLGTARGMNRAAATAIVEAPRTLGEEAVAATARIGGRVLVTSDADYPELLIHIPEPAPVLFALGDLTLLRRDAVAVVGSRAPTMYGIDACRRVVGQAAGAGLAVVSGMARGLDAVAHEQALALRGGTIGVLGNGLGVVYPAANRALYERMAASGLLLTEFAPGERPNAGSFPRRNRLISGLARVTVVVEAAEKSGALITATTALDQGREVLGVPGPITSPTSVGVNRLLREGAAPYLEPEDLLRHFPNARRPGAPTAAPALPDRDLPTGAGADLARVAALLDCNGSGVDTLATRARMPVAELLGHLSALEIAGVAEQLEGARFRRVDRV